MARKKKKSKAGRKPAPKKKAVARQRKPALTRAHKIKASLPDYVTGFFVVAVTDGTTCVLTDKADEFSVDVTAAERFASKADAQTAIDAALVLADEDDLITTAEIVKASTLLRMAYDFDFVDGAWMLRARVVPKTDDTGKTFMQAKSAITRLLTDTLRGAESALDKFTKAWG